MGKIQIRMKVWNFLDNEKVKKEEIAPIELNALVDTGATLFSLPEEVVEKLGFVIREKPTRVKYANGKIEEKQVALGVSVEILGRETTTSAVVENKGATPLVGQVVLESLDLIADCKKGILTTRPESPDIPLMEQL